MRRPIVGASAGIVTIVVLLVAGAGTAGAQTPGCGCPPGPDDDDRLAAADVVFEGRAVGEVELVIPDGSPPADGWSLVVTAVLKGELPDEQLVAQDPQVSDCGDGFQVDGEYLVFATDDRADLPADVVAVGPCSGTRPLARAFTGDAVRRPPSARPVDPEVLGAADEALARRRRNDRLTLRAFVAFAGISVAAVGAAVWLWRGRPSA